MEEHVQLCCSIKFKNKVFFIFMASLSYSVQASRNYIITAIWPSYCFIKNWINNELMNDKSAKDITCFVSIFKSNDSVRPLQNKNYRFWKE